MHILYLHQYFCPPGGAGNNRSFELARAWVAQGHRVTIICSAAYFPEQLRLAKDMHAFDCEGIAVIALRVPYAHLMRYGARVRSFLRFYRKAKKVAEALPKPDLIYASSTPPTVGELGRKLSAKWRIPFVFETVDVWPDVPIGMGIVNNRFLQRWLHHRVDQIYEAASMIVALSDGMRDQILGRGVPPDKVQISYNGTHLDAFPYVERVAMPTVRVVYTGTVGIANGADVVPRLCKRLEELGRTDIEVQVLGGGNALAAVKSLAGALQVRNLEFLATIPKEKVPNFLAQADIGLVTFAPFPVLEANSANKFYDYLASGLPVLINYRGWQSRYLADRQCGLSSDMGDLEGLVANLLQMADDVNLRKEMGRRGRALAQEKFDRSTIALELLTMFDEILKRNGFQP